MTHHREQSIVIVDDEKSYVDLLAETLGEQFQHPIVTFTRPLAALEAIPRLNPGIIVTDYYMPQLSGLDLIRQVAALKPGVPCIVITGHSVLFAADDFPHLPALKSILHKPFTCRRLAEEITHVWPAAGAAVAGG